VDSGVSRKYLWLLLALASAVYFIALGNSAIWDANEAFYVETPREMLEANDFVNPTFNYRPRFNKPVLSYWIVAGFYHLFGVSVGVQRFAIALGAVILIGCAFLLARIGMQDAGTGIQDERSAIRDSAAFWAAAGLAAAPRLVMFARRIFIDIWISAFLALTLVCFALSERYPERRRLYLSLMYAAIGFGVLTKGPVAIALPALAFGLYLLVRGELRRVTTLMIPLGVVIVAAIVVPWYLALYREHGWTYISSFLINENVERFTQGVGVRQPRPVWFYLPVVLSDSFPWSLLLPLAAVISWRQRSRIETLLWCWIGAIVGFFSLSAGKQDLYIFPIVPAVAALGGIAVARGLAADRSAIARSAKVDGWRRGLTWTVGVAGVLLAAAGAAVLALFVAAGTVYALSSAVIVGATGLAGGVVVVGFAVWRRPREAALALLTCVIAVNWVFVLRVLPEFERYKPVPEMTAAIQQRAKADDAVAHYRVALPSMAYYLRRHFEGFDSRDAFIEFMRRQGAFAVMRAEDYRDVAADLGPRACIVGEWDAFQAKLKDVLAHRPLPKLVLVYNRCQP
jgi:4-amino-4-deoxy-L-arabinose transferase-like glycosyltransferase